VGGVGEGRGGMCFDGGLNLRSGSVGFSGHGMLAVGGIDLSEKVSFMRRERA
jgi:hypothetical protein